MQALVYHHSPVKYILCSLLGRIMRRRFFPKAAPVTLKEVPEPVTPKGWVSLRVRMCGICGSDLNLMRGAESLLMEPYASFPAILGHEILADVTHAPQNSGFAPGDRVVVEPVLSCEQRGLPLCPSCLAGNYNLCENFTKGELSAGMVLGYNKSVGGGMAEHLFAHPSRLVRVPEEIPDETAILADSAASALQPVLENYPEDNDTVVVYGAGVIGQHVIRCLRALGSKAKILTVARYPFQRDLALAGGADEVLMSPSRVQLGQAVGAELLKTTLGGGNLEGGANMFFDCVGSGRSMQEGLLSLRARGTYVMVGTAGMVGKVDFSSLWQRQLNMTGTSCYSHATHKGKNVRTYPLIMQLLTEGKYATKGLLTHVFTLNNWEEALQTMFDKRTTQSMKVALDPRKCV